MPIPRQQHLLGVVLVSLVAAPCQAAPKTGAKRKPPAAASQKPQTRPAATRPGQPRFPELQSLAVSPASLTLDGPRDERRLLVTGKFSDGIERDLGGLARVASAQPRIAAVDGAGVKAAGDGEAHVKVTVGRLSAWAKVTVRNSAAETPISFDDEVLPVLTKSGCNQGACHGSQHGKGGFKLSLLGYDPDVDYAAIVRQNEGRRVIITDSAASLLLTKAVLGVPHAGGKRFEKDGYEYRTLLAWLNDGAPAPDPKGRTVKSLEVLPAARLTTLPRESGDQGRSVLIPQAKGPATVVRLQPAQQLVALAQYSDGAVADVSRRAQFNSLNDGTAEVDAAGRSVMKARGETSVMVRYRGQATVARLTAPYAAIASFPELPRANFIDEQVQVKWKEMGLLPSSRAADAEFLRRASLDLIGALPTPDEVRAFLKSDDPQKREKLVDALLARPEYVDAWTLKWGDLLRNNRDKLGEKGMWSFYNWLRTSFRENKPLDRFASELITAQGSTFTNGPANYFRVVSAPGDLAETTSQVFLGIRMACAKCHHHPFEKWSQDDYWQLAAYFARVGLKGSQEFGLFGGEQAVRVNSSGEVRNPRSGQVMKPTPLDGTIEEDPVDRRRSLARWMTSPDNMMFARNIVNRYWGYLMGRGLVDPLDDMRVTNPASNPSLLDALAKDFVAHKFDAKHLLRTIALSETYQLSSQPTRENLRDQSFYTKYAVKRLGAEELLDALNSATGVPDKFPNLPPGMRASQIPDPGVQNYFLETFGRPERAIVCECERSAEPNMAQALHLMNSDFVQGKLTSGSGRLAALISAKKTDPEVVEELYLATFSRMPTAEEQEQATQVITQAPNRKEGLEDLLWALLNSREFLLNH